jgi:hypothetical protein
MSQSKKLARSRFAILASAFAVSASIAGFGAGGSGAQSAAPTVLPRNTSPPTISGTERVGETLTGNPGSWTGTAPITFSYQWIRCNSRSANCAAIRGATSRQYTLTADDLGRRLLFLVTARNADGSANARASTGVIERRATAPRNTTPPTISGTPREGAALTANRGQWTGSTPMTFAYQWQRCDASGGNCSNIIGATQQTYTLTSADVGRTIRVVVTARNTAGSASRTSVPSAVVQAGPAPGPPGQIRLPNGEISVPVTSVTLPVRLIVDRVQFSPNPVRSRTRSFQIRVKVEDTRGFVVRGALVFVRPTPLVSTAPPETPTAQDGWATLRSTPRSRPGIRFPLQRGLNVQFYAQARKPGERLLAGVTGTRLVQVATAPPR